jgi:DNA-binding NtrC family response regulator
MHEAYAMTAKILIVDDEPLLRKAFSSVLTSAGFSVIEAVDGKEALPILAREKADIVLLDLKMPGIGGIDVLKEIKNTFIDLPVIMITAHGDVSAAVNAMKIGASDFLLKPVDFDHLLIIINRALEKNRLNSELKRLEESIEYSLEMMLGRSDAIKKVIVDIRNAVSYDFSLIIEGETGTGKTFLASIIHNLSRRAKEPFITIDIGTIPETLIESELFGYAKGAFTGALQKKKGYFELAHKGTIFLDELQNMNSNLQSKLLKVVEEKRFYPVGSSDSVEIDVRVICSTNMNIGQAVKEKRFREDLYYRLNQFTITLPPLRERIEDISFLAESFRRDFSSDMKKNLSSITDQAVSFLQKQPWPGNVRELKNVMRKAVLLSEKDVITLELVSQIVEDSHKAAAVPAIPLSDTSSVMSINEAEKIAIRKALEHTAGNKTRAAEILQITRKTLLKKIKNYSLC